MLKYILVLCLSINLAWAAGSAKLIDFMVSESGVVELLGRYGIKGADAEQVKSYVASSIVALNSKGQKITKSELAETLSRLPVTGQDATYRKELQVLLDKSDGTLQKDDVVKAINHIIYLANRHGKSVIITCSECVNESLAKNGFKFTVEAIKSAKTVELLTNVIPSKPAELNSFISARMRKLGVGDYSKVTPDLVSPTEEKSLAIFLALSESGTKEQKDLIGAVKRLSTTNGKVNIIDPANPHKFWRELSTDMSPDTLKGWTQTLNEVADKRAKEGISAEEAFFKSLKEKADKNPELKKEYEQLKAKRCFFK